MKTELKIDHKYLYLPIKTGEEEVLLEIFDVADGTKLYEFKVPVNMEDMGIYDSDFMAEIVMPEHVGKTLEIRAEAPENFFEAILCSDKIDQAGTLKTDRPVIHYTTTMGWTNDPNGLICKDGIYHLYYQYNPMNIRWSNMSWGHAVSMDLLHWEEQDAVMYPDEDGTIYSGCAIPNDQGLLGLPEDAIIFFYTGAGGNDNWNKGKTFVQKIAYSLDGGQTLTRMEGYCIGSQGHETRDPKVFWHEETGAYIMVLYLERNDFAIYRSTDLQHWDRTDTFTLEEAWECPDLLRLRTDKGENCWFFWCADGYHYAGVFDGYRFVTDGKRRYAYISRLPYAAQTYAGTGDRVISLPWYRSDNDGRAFTGAYGIPTEMTCKRTDKGFVLLQRPVRELLSQMRPVHTYGKGQPEKLSIPVDLTDKAVVMRFHMEINGYDCFNWRMKGCHVQYQPATGIFWYNNEKHQIGTDYTDFLFVIDDKIMEIYLGDGDQVAAYWLPKRPDVMQVETACMKQCQVFEIR